MCEKSNNVRIFYLISLFRLDKAINYGYHYLNAGLCILQKRKHQLWKLMHHEPKLRSQKPQQQYQRLLSHPEQQHLQQNQQQQQQTQQLRQQRHHRRCSQRGTLLNGLATLHWFVLMCSVVCVVGKHRSDVVNGARCQVRCLTLLQNRQRIPQEIFVSKAPVSLAECQIDQLCSDCSRPCEEPFQGEKHCDSLCTRDNRVYGRSDCQESCRFLTQVNSIRPGTCPPETQATGFAALCKKVCDSDADCETGLKCCSNGCGWTCQQPTHMFDGMPDIPEAIRTVESHLESDSIDLQWRPISHNTSGHVMYIVEARSDIGAFLNEPAWPRWSQIAQTTGYSTTVKGLRPGAWYQYRVMAVNIYGTRGPSQHSLPFTLSKEPRKPDPPTNLTEGDTLIKDGKIAVSIHWSPPKSSDLPVTRYKIFWSKRLKTVAPQFVNLQEFKETVSAERTTFRITDLEPDTSYFIQIQAICQHGDVRLKSEKSNLQITTYPLPFSPNLALPVTTLPPVAVRPLPTPVQPVGLAVEKTYYLNGLLRANISWQFDRVMESVHEASKVLIYWSLEGCATVKISEEGRVPPMSASAHDRHFTIYDLRFDCRYLLRLQSVSAQGTTGEIAHLFFSTPPCTHVLVIGETQPDCLTRNVRIPGEPLDLNYQFIVGNSNITAKITWSEPVSEVPIVGYIIVWGQVLEGGQYLLMDWSSVQTRTVSKEVRSLILSDLSEATTYAVRVQATTRTVEGRVSGIRLTTPNLQPIISDPPYKEVSMPGRVDNVRPSSKHSRNSMEEDEVYDDDDDDDGPLGHLDISAATRAPPTWQSALRPSPNSHQINQRRPDSVFASTAAPLLVTCLRMKCIVLSVAFFFLYIYRPSSL